MKKVTNLFPILLVAVLVGCAASERFDGYAELSSASSSTPTSLASHSEAPTSKQTIINITSNDDFDSIINSSTGNVLIDFYADWCGPCKTQSRILHEMEMTASSNNAIIIKINVDQRRDLADKFQITALPTLILLKDQQIVERQMGLASQTRIASLLSQ